MMRKLLSVVLTNYNNGQWLEQCIECICNQSYRDLDIIIVDDGSVDNSRSIIDAWKTRDDRIQIVYKEHEGAASARKAGIRKAKGQYVTFPDGDDWIEENMYVGMMEKVIEEQADVVCDNIYFRESDDGREIVGRAFEEKCYRNEELDALRNTIFDIAPSLWLKIFKTDVIKDYIEEVDFRTQVSNDMQASYPGIMKAKSICMVNYPAYHYRVGHRPPSGRGPVVKAESYALTYKKLHQCFEGDGELLKILDKSLLSGQRILYLISQIYSRRELKLVGKGEGVGYALRSCNSDLLNVKEKKIVRMMKKRQYRRLAFCNRFGLI